MKNRYITVTVIITYQEKLGNYNYITVRLYDKIIITYQEKLGNYNNSVVTWVSNMIITYQEKLGNYNVKNIGSKAK